MLELSILILCGILTTILSDGPPPNNAWKLQHSDPSRGGKFLSIPVHYGDWVPLNHAKSLINDLASRVTGQKAAPHQVQQEDTLVAPAPEADERVDRGELIYVNTVPKKYKYGGYQPRRPAVPPPSRRQDRNQYQYQTNNRRNRKIPQPQSQFRGKPVNQPFRPAQPTKKISQKQRPGLGFVPSLNPIPSVNPFTFFDQSKPKQRPTQAQTKQKIPQEKQQNYLESLNAIRTIPSPDLTKFGPPIIELGAGADGEIILGRPANQDHLAGFVSLDFDGFTPGDREDKKWKKQQEKDKLSILVGGSNDIDSNDQSDLVNFLNNDGYNNEAFVYESDKKAPKGFSKIDLPFMDPTKHKGLLPKAFIAPKGAPIPFGYKGKPLPPKPNQVEKSTTEKTLLIQDESIKEEEKLTPISLFNRRPTGSFLRPIAKLTTKAPVKEVTTTTVASKLSNSLRYKLQKNRPSLTQFYLKNKKKALEQERKKEFYKKQDTLEKTYLKDNIKSTKKEIKDNGSKPTDLPVPLSTTYYQLADSKFSSGNTIQHAKDGQEIVPTTESIVKQDEKDETTVAKELTAIVTTLKDTFPVIDNDPISIVYQPFEEAAVLSTLEQLESEKETSTNFAPTVSITTTDRETTTTPQSTSTITIETSPTTTTITTTTITTTTTTPTTTTTTPTTTETVKETTVAVEEEVSSTTELTEALQTSSITQLTELTKLSPTTQDPIIKLETLRKQKIEPKVPAYQGDLLSGDDVDEFNTEGTQTPVFNFVKPFRNRLRFKKYKGVATSEGGAVGKFGKRLRSRVRPGQAFWANRFGQGLSVEPTPRPGPFKVRQRLVSTSTEEPLVTNESEGGKPEDYKKKFRPFFDQLYSSLTKGSEEEADNRRYGLPRRRSTTPSSLVTVDAEIYEVHPKTRVRVTTRKPSAPTTAAVQTESSTFEDGDFYTYQDDYLYEPTTSQAPETEEDYTTTPYEEVSYITTFDEANPPKEYQEYIPVPQAGMEYDPFGIKMDDSTKVMQTTKDDYIKTSTDEVTSTSTTTVPTIVSTTELVLDVTEVVHETADKHATTTHEIFETETAILNDLVGDILQEDFKIQQIDLDIGNEIADQVFEESQQVETTWNGVFESPEEQTVSSNGRLTDYQKTIDTSMYGSDKEYKKEDLSANVNEHGQQGLAAGEGSGDNTDLDSYAGWQASVQPLKPYYEINRSEGKSPIVSIEEVEITETKDYSEPDIIYDLTKESFDDDKSKDSFSVPVFVALNVPETTTTLAAESSVSTTQADQTTTEYKEGSTTTVATTTTTEEQSTTAVPTTSTELTYPTTTVVLTSEPTQKTVTTYSRIYNIINRSRASTNPPNRDVFEEIFLGSTARTSTSTEEDTENKSTTPVTDLGTVEELYADVTTQKTFEAGAHKIPKKLWTAYEKSLEDETTTEKSETDGDSITREATVPKEQEENTEGFNVASIMSYVMPTENSNVTATPEIVEIVEIDELPKPSEHESEVLVIEQLPQDSGNKAPKAFDFGAIPTDQSLEHGNIQIHTFGVEQLIPLRKPDGKYKKKTETKTKKREEWIKNWVARKYNKPKFPRGPILPLAPTAQHEPASVQHQASQPVTTELPDLQPSLQPDSQPSRFAPTVPPKPSAADLTKTLSEPTSQPKNSRFNVNFDVTVRDGSVQKQKPTSANDLKTSLLEKYSSSRHNLVKNSRFITNNKGSEELRKSPTYTGGVPRGAKADVFKNYAGDKLSQADFERQILGVSTATEISVRSMICVKGRCFNADDMGKLLSK